MEKRSSWSFFWSISPFFITTTGLPLKTRRILRLWRFMAEMITSKVTRLRMGSRPEKRGVSTSSMGRVAMLEIRMVTTSSEG